MDNKEFQQLALVPKASTMTDKDYILIVSGNSVRRLDAEALLDRLKRLEEFLQSHTFVVSE